MIAVETQTAGHTLDTLLSGFVETPASSLVNVMGLCHDSRRIRPGEGFVALAGHRSHGMRHAEQAIRQGCSAIIYDPAGGGDLLARNIAALPCVKVDSLDQKLGFIADRFFGEPSAFQDVIGITGTNGKTSCSHFLANALSAKAPAAVVGTLGWGVPGALEMTQHTTPDAIEVHGLLARLRERGIRIIAMEASSHGQVQGRLNGVRFKGALYTNFSRDHLDYHGTMEAYLEAKLRLLASPGLEFVVFNADDPIADVISSRAPFQPRPIGFSVHGRNIVPDATVSVTSILQDSRGIAFRAVYRQQATDVFAPVYGDFNVENLTASLAVLLGLGYELPEAAELLKNVRPVPGRMERFSGLGRTAIVDYAHTPDALESVLRSLRRHCEGKLWVVFGCGGDRDRGKRPLMGAVAEKLADGVVLTDDNPRSENGDEIIRDILSGCRRDNTVSIRDRRAAIAFALERAGMGDIVVVAGKGHEQTQEIRGQKYPFCDREVVTEILSVLEWPR
ncbi:UDP-N-acetylmuramoyl-L-alanyl-D-glutamate--2,6-diaminopimelate ligase [Methylocaldum marinum]|uniref:UDP-N-acetylmuramoyl-L-alanyl-D-glutamate--2,6-diaminopimelate ligase n=1 Tax=Methylocaldum marinum TaxID=1432792 RepID=A0A250L2A9_9GAMM|nr:UDP-N-acetylmuramoyl-L-alanyl-D-glutamate--2,6-diaminopimelate ligase [Methylocaldum marinum]BBA36569.1 UDP-N-acetylmuramoyl-L-alanyl-D-glutamate--2,6-diaminopimelate ligase [Methylocaldum marinum]